MRSTRVFLANVGTSRQNDQINPPIGLLYIAAWLRQHANVEVQVVSQRDEGISSDELIKRFVAFEADIVGLGCMTPYAFLLPEIIDGIRAALPDALIILGGPHVSGYGAAALEAINAHAAVDGEGETSMGMIVNAWESGSDFSDIPGLIWRNTEGEVITNPGETPFIKDMDTLPFPAYDLIDIKKYWKLTSQMLLPYPRKYILMITSRGCPYKCAYCSNMFGRNYRHYSAERMVEEIAHFHAQYQMEELVFYEDTFNIKRQRLLDFSEQLQARVNPLKISFPTGLRADLIDEQSLDALVGAGMYCCHYSLESGSPRIQTLIDKNLDIDKFQQCVDWSVRRGVFTHGYVMMGFPTETETDMLKTIQAITSSRLHTMECFSVTPWPNTSLTQYVREHSPEKLKGILFDDEEYWRIRINLSEVSDEKLLYYERKVYRDFYLRPSRLYRILRDYPNPLYLPSRIPDFVKRVTKGLINS